MEELFIQFLTTGNLPLEFRMQLDLPNEIKDKIKKCSNFLKTNGVINKVLAEKFIKTLWD